MSVPVPMFVSMSMAVLMAVEVMLAMLVMRVVNVMGYAIVIIVRRIMTVLVLPVLLPVTITAGLAITPTLMLWSRLVLPVVPGRLVDSVLYLLLPVLVFGIRGIVEIGGNGLVCWITLGVLDVQVNALVFTFVLQVREASFGIVMAMLAASITLDFRGCGAPTRILMMLDLGLALPAKTAGLSKTADEGQNGQEVAPHGECKCRMMICIND
ncbi:hypothetical protein NM208_g13041 [Fusarium decemcellulare]|uniref:Uncharacterized protein n=1 Tax=Fusarium decemcellulare TaxID=57161 RepID=A0ACC1RP04_9HYPO|nr:hypothetical protein NM208_g13041 [Fusarium decemcellulare]